MSEREKFSKRRPRYIPNIGFRHKQHGHIPLARLESDVSEFIFILVSEHCQTTGNRNVGLSNTMPCPRKYR